MNDVSLNPKNLEQVMKSIEQIDIEREIQSFADRFSKEPTIQEQPEKEPVISTFSSSPVCQVSTSTPVSERFAKIIEISNANISQTTDCSSTKWHKIP